MKKEKLKFDLEERLIEFSLIGIEISELLPNTVAGRHIGGQLVRAATSPAFNYGEAQSAESRKDFIHKMKVALKELRETYICLKIIKRKPLIKNMTLLEEALGENDQLISIFVKSVSTAKHNLKKE